MLSFRALFQSHLTGIEIIEDAGNVLARTCSNRTLLELKYGLRRLDEVAGQVPIVPYWN